MDFTDQHGRQEAVAQRDLVDFSAVELGKFRSDQEVLAAMERFAAENYRKQTLQEDAYAKNDGGSLMETRKVKDVPKVFDKSGVEELSLENAS